MEEQLNQPDQNTDSDTDNISQADGLAAEKLSIENFLEEMTDQLRKNFDAKAIVLDFSDFERLIEIARDNDKHNELDEQIAHLEKALEGYEKDEAEMKTSYLELEKKYLSLALKIGKVGTGNIVGLTKKDLKLE